MPSARPVAVARVPPPMELLLAWKDRLLDALNTAHPALFLAAMVLLPLGPFPASVLFILAGLRFGWMLPPACRDLLLAEMDVLEGDDEDAYSHLDHGTQTRRNNRGVGSNKSTDSNGAKNKRRRYLLCKRW